MITSVLSLRSLSTGLGVVAMMLSTQSTFAQVTAFSQDSLPDAVKVPMGYKVMLESMGVGEITYECRAKKDAADQTEWFFVGPDAKLLDRTGKQFGKYYGPPATWEALDGSKLTATQLAVSPGGTGNIPLQLVKANPVMGAGAMQGTQYIQRVNTKGGTAPAVACTPANVGQQQAVPYQADYIFWSIN